MKWRWGVWFCLMLVPASASAEVQEFGLNQVVSTTSSMVVVSAAGLVMSTVLLVQEASRAPTRRPNRRRRQEKKRKRHRRFLRMMRTESRAVEHAVMMGQGGVVEDLAMMFEVETRHSRAFARMLRAQRAALMPHLAGGDEASASAFLEEIERAMFAHATLRPGYVFRIAVLDVATSSPTRTR